MIKKAPRRTAERILEVTLGLFNRFGEPNVSTTLISAELNISPGNLYYHYPAKDELINALFDRFERPLNELLGAGDDVRNVEDAWFYMHTLFELAIPVFVPGPERPAEQKPTSGNALSIDPEKQNPLHQSLVGRHAPWWRAAN
jgi:AcrR family transcriptional regulator